MKIVAKSKFNNQIYDKIMKGATAIELHLDQEFVNNPMTWNEQIVADAPIVAVHVPLIEGENDLNVEVQENRQVLAKTCGFAMRIAHAQHHPVTVVCHLGTSPKLLKQLGAYENLIFFMRDLANTYEQLEFAIENMIPIENGAKKKIGFRQIDFDSAPEFVRDINHPRIGTCLDVCHAMMMLRFVQNTANYIEMEDFNGDNMLRFGLEAFFDTNKDTIKWMHLSNTKKHGFKDDHGMPFTNSDEDLEILQHILWLYKKYNYKCPMVLEVKEDNYSDAKCYEETFETLKNQLYLIGEVAE